MARTPSEHAAFLARRAADGAWLVAKYGLTPTPPRHNSRFATRDSHRRTRSESPDGATDSAVETDAEAAHGRSSESVRARNGTVWRDVGLVQISRELNRRTRTPEDRERLARAMAGAETALDWPHLFPGHSFTAEQLRRLVGRRIIAALHNGAERTLQPRSDNLAEMWNAFPTEAITPVTRADCWWAHGLSDPTIADPRLPPADTRLPTLRQDGFYDYHCQQCRKHDRDSATGAWLDEAAHWNCEIHQQLFSICDVRLPFKAGARPVERLIYKQTLETDPALAALLTAAIDAAIAAGSMVYARRDEPLIIVPSRGVFKWALAPSPEEQALYDRGASVVELASSAASRVARMVPAAVALDRLPSTARGTALAQIIRAECGPPKVRVVTRHDIGCNQLIAGPSLRYGSVTELASHARPGYTSLLNDHHRGYNSQRLASDSQPYAAVWHPSIPNVALIMTSLDFGLSCAPFFFSCATAMVQWTIVWWLGPDGHSIYYLDDNGIVCRADRADALQEDLDTMARRCGWLYALDKRQRGLIAKFLGCRFSIEGGMLTILLPKLHRTLVLLGLVAGLIDEALADPACTADVMEHRFLDRLAGTLGWLASCSYAGLLHMGPFYYAARVSASQRLPRLSRVDGLREACQWWLDRASSGRLRGHRRLPCVSIPSLQIAFDPTYSAQQATVAAGSALTDADNVETLVSAHRADGGAAHCLQLDAAADAWAVIINGIAFWGLWSELQRSWSSGGREFYGPLQALRRRPDIFRNAFVVIGFDNASDALALCLGRARGVVERRLLAELFECADDLDAELVVWWCSRRMNAAPDQLSKCSSVLDARRWCEERSLELVVCNDILEDYVLGSLATPERR